MEVSAIFNFITKNSGELLIYLAGFLWAIELFPQIIKTHKTKDVSGLSIGFFTMCLMAYTLYTVGNIILKNWIIVYSHIPALVLNTIMLAMIAYYRKGKNNGKTKGKIYEY